MTAFTDAYTTEEDGGTYICYRSGMLVYEELIENTRPYAVGWGISGYPPQTATTGGVPRVDPHGYAEPYLFRLSVDGTDLVNGYEFLGFDKQEKDGVLHISFRLSHQRFPIEVTVHTCLDGTNTITRYLSVKNNSDQPHFLTRLTVMSGGIAQGGNLPIDRMFRLGYMMDSHGGCEGDYHEIDLPRNRFAFGRKMYTERYRDPFFCLQNNAVGTVMLASLGFSGAYEFGFQNCSVYGNTELSFTCDVGAVSPLRVLDAGESFDSPALHIAMLAGTPDDAINEMNDHLRIYNRDYPKEGLLEFGIGPEVDMSQEMILGAIDRAADFGAEVFYIDASWYGPEHAENNWPSHCGNWDPKPLRYPMSMCGIQDYAKSRGLKFGLWVDCEKIGPQSEIWDTAYPPRLHDYDGHTTRDGGCRTVDMSVPEGIAWAEQTICSLIEKYDLDFFRIDSGAYSFTSAMEYAGLTENRDLKYYENWYGLFMRLRKKYPKVIFQNCAGGGARLDPGMIRPVSNTWITDQQVAPMSYRVINGCSMLLPCEYFVRGIGGQNVHIAASLDFQLNVARFGHPVCSYNTPAWLALNETQATKIKRMLQTYKEVIRPALPNCRIYHHTPEIDEMKPDSVGILELAAADRHMSMIGVFTLTKPENPEITVQFCGVDCDAMYDVTVNDVHAATLRGYELAEHGFTVRIPNALDSKAIIARRI